MPRKREGFDAACCLLLSPPSVLRCVSTYLFVPPPRVCSCVLGHVRVQNELLCRWRPSSFTDALSRPPAVVFYGANDGNPIFFQRCFVPLSRQRMRLALACCVCPTTQTRRIFLPDGMRNADASSMIIRRKNQETEKYRISIICTITVHSPAYSIHSSNPPVRVIVIGLLGHPYTPTFAPSSTHLSA